jgi:hypothetical protein
MLAQAIAEYVDRSSEILTYTKCKCGHRLCTNETVFPVESKLFWCESCGYEEIKTIRSKGEKHG